MEIVELIKKHRIMIRPALLSKNWIAGKFKGIRGTGEAYCHDATKFEAENIKKAVAGCVEKIDLFEKRLAEKGLTLSR